METFRVRLNCVDYYQSAPTQFDPQLFGSYGSTQQRNSPTVPVVRVFGSTETGQKVCVHIHGALPYLYVEYRGSLEQYDVNVYIQQLRSSIDHALAVSYRRNVYDGKAIFVGHISLVKGVPFFGYHIGYRYFLKIYLLNPNHMTRFADLLYQGAIMKQVLQPFESHIQYLLQWMCDYNLYGCANIDCKTVKFRAPIPDFYDLENKDHRWHDQSIGPEQVSDEASFPRQSHCSLEVDVRVEDILNRMEVQMRDLHKDFVERFHAAAPEEKLVHSLAGLWRDESRRRRLRLGLVDPSSSPFPPEVLISMSADARNDTKGGWIHEDEYREMVEELAKGEHSASDGSKLGFDEFLKPHKLESTIQTVLDSVEDLFSARIVARNEFVAGNTVSEELKEGEEAVVNEKSIPTFDPDDFPYDSDEDIARELAMSQRARLNGQQRKRQLPNSQDGMPRDQPNTSPRPKRDVDKAASICVVKEEGSDEHLADVDFQQDATTETGHYDAFDFPLPASKRRKVEFEADGQIDDALKGSAGSENISNSQTRRVKFLERDDKKLQASSQNSSGSQRRDSEGASSSQLSQTSIKGHGRDATGSIGFPVSKFPSSQEKSNQAASDVDSNQSKKSPRTPNSLKTSETSTKSPFGNAISSQTTESTRSDSEVSSQLLNMIASLESFPSYRTTRSLIYSNLPPSSSDVFATMTGEQRPQNIYQDAYYSNELDVPERPRNYGGREFKLESSTVPFLPEFDPSGASPASFGAKERVLVDSAKQEAMFQKQRRQCNLQNWDYASAPPTWDEVDRWIKREKRKLSSRRETPNTTQDSASEETTFRNQPLSQIDGPTQRNRYGFKFTQKQESTSVQHETQYMSTMALEIHVNTRGDLAPNPEHDEVACVFWHLKSDDEKGERLGIVLLSPEPGVAERLTGQFDVEVDVEQEELDLINRMVDIVHEMDPDVLTGFEVHNSSWGYLIERSRIKFEYNLCDEFSRMKSQSHGRFGKDADRWGFNTTSTIRVTGRHMINIWRAMRSEINLLQYTMENICFHLLHKRVPHYQFSDLTTWYKSKTPAGFAKVIDYFLSRVQLDLDILAANELIPRTSEQARLLGVDFFSVFSRGSQFKVESFMFRIAKPENFVLVSPSKKQIGGQNALECIPLVMEPRSDFYNSPVLVLDFQSLYPSIMIAYNYCYSTCLGRVVNWRGQNKLGFADFKRQPRLLELVKDRINIAPNGIIFVKGEMRKSLLAKMLSEILETRVMVKSGMKVDKHDKTLQQLLNNRQLALKLMANVTYGYTSASFSGRMPCVEIADSIVQTARETLEKTIAFIHSVERWGAEVVYGDTDSLFVYLKGQTKDQAFDIGEEIAKEVTAMNPRPVKLKFEKVYLPCVLLAKKRYVGFKYESKTQVEPEFDAKGIETVRRDGTPAEQKIEEKALKILFRTADLSQVKQYFQQQCTKIMQGKVSIQDFCFAREVKLGTYADKGPPPPGALISTKRMLADPRTEPQYGERVPYVVVTGAPGARLIDRCVAPEQLLKGDGGTELDAEYYISKNLIPPLERIFNLVGANVRQWYDEMPKVLRVRDRSVFSARQKPQYAPNGALIAQHQRRTLESYMHSSHCIVCRAKLPPPPAGRGHQERTPLCSACQAKPSSSLFALRSRLRAAEKKRDELEIVCRSCAGLPFGDEVKCDSKDCPVFYSRVRALANERGVADTVGSVVELLERENGGVEW